MRERKLERVCFEASTTSLLTSSAEGIEGPFDDDDEEEEEEDIFDVNKKRKENKVQGNGNEGEVVAVMGWSCAIGFWRDRGTRGAFNAKPLLPFLRSPEALRQSPLNPNR